MATRLQGITDEIYELNTTIRLLRSDPSVDARNKSMYAGMRLNILRAEIIVVKSHMIDLRWAIRH